MSQFNLPALVQYKSKKFIAYRETDKAKVKLITWGDTWEFAKYQGTPARSSVAALKSFDSRSWNGHNYFKAQGVVFSCSTGDQIVDGNILALFGDELTYWAQSQSHAALREVSNAVIPDQEVSSVHVPVVVPEVVVLPEPVSSSKSIKEEVGIMIDDRIESEVVELLEDSSSRKGSHGRLYHLLHKAAKGKPYKVYSYSVPSPTKMSHDEYQNAMGHLVNFFDAVDENIIGGVNKGTKIIFALAEEKVHWLSWFSGMGIKVFDGAKTSKRLSQLLRPYIFFGEVPTAEITYKVIKGKETTLMGKTFKGIDITLDGAIAIRFTLFKKLVDQTIKVLVELGEIKTAQRLKRLGYKTKVFNGRLWLPGVGFIKGQFFVTDSISVDIVFHEVNIKEEVTIDSDVAYLGMDPQPGKLVAWTNKQAMVNFPWAHGIGHRILAKDGFVYGLAKAEIESTVKAMLTGKVLDTVDDLVESLQASRLENSEGTQQRFRAAAFAEITDLRECPALLGQTAKSGLDRVANRQDQKIRVKIPGGVYCQVVSQAVMALMGIYVAVEARSIVYNETYMVFVMEDADYIENRVNHGGPDMDDKFTLVFTKYRGEVVVFLYRNPSDRGEYNVLKFVGTPPVPLSPYELPVSFGMKISKLLAQGLGEGVVPETPEWCKDEKGVSDKLYTKEIFLLDIRNAAGSPGTYISLIRLYNLSFPERNRNTFLPCGEDIVDTFVQTRNQAKMKWIKKAGRKMFIQMMRSNCTFDYAAIQSCKGLFKKAVFNRLYDSLKAQGRIQDSWYTLLVKECFELIAPAKKVIDLEVGRVRIRNNYLKLIDLKSSSHATMFNEYYIKMCNSYCFTPDEEDDFRTRKGSVNAKGHAHIKKLIEGLRAELIGKLDTIGYKNPWHVAMAGMAYAGHHATSYGKLKTDHIMTRGEMFDTYLDIVRKFKGKSEQALLECHLNACDQDDML